MRAAIVRQGRIVIDEAPDPVPGPGEVLVKTRACGICGSDLHALAHTKQAAETARRAGSFFRADPDRDMIAGHEFCAEIVDHGPNTERRLKPGALVCSTPVLLGPDGVEPIGFSNDVPGGYGQYMRLMEGLLLEVPDGVTPEMAALTEPIAVGVHAVDRARMSSTEAAVVIGCGPVGLAVIGALRARDIRPIVAADFSQSRRELAVNLGADAVVDPRERSPFGAFEEMALAPPEEASPRPVWMAGPSLKHQVVFECVGVPGVVQQIMESAEPGARIMVVGVCMEKDTIEPMFGINKELDLSFTFGYSAEQFAAALRHITEGTIDAATMLTGRTGLPGVAFEALSSAEAHAKIVIDPWSQDGLESLQP